MDEAAPKSKRFLVVYMAVLLMAALVLLTLSHLASIRDRDRLSDLEQEHTAFSVTANLSFEELRGEAERLEGEVARLAGEKEGLAAQLADEQDSNAALTEELNEVNSLLSAVERNATHTEQGLNTVRGMLEFLNVYDVKNKDSLHEAALLAAQWNESIFVMIGRYETEDSAIAQTYWAEYVPAVYELEKLGYVVVERYEDSDRIDVYAVE